MPRRTKVSRYYAQFLLTLRLGVDARHTATGIIVGDMRLDCVNDECNREELVSMIRMIRNNRHLYPNMNEEMPPAAR